jgi:hypothetical protein
MRPKAGRITAGTTKAVTFEWVNGRLRIASTMHTG